MLLLPIVERELRVAARNWRTYLTRVTTGGAALGFVIYLIWMVRYAMPGAIGGMFLLKASSYLAWAICVIVGANRTCDAISSEKRGDTIGLLFLTHLKGYDVVLGKLLASCLSVFFLLVGVVPILSIPVLVGGVSGAELVRIPIVLLNSLFVAASLGLLASSLMTTQRAASTVAGAMLVFLSVLLPITANVLETEMGWIEVAKVLRIPSLTYAVEMAFGSSIGLSTNYFWKAILVQFCIGLAALGSTCWIVPRSWQVQAGNGATVRWKERFIRWTHGDPVVKRMRRTALLAKSPMFWLACRDRFAPLWPVVFVVVMLGAVGWCIVHYEIPKDPACGMLFAILAVNDITNRMRVATLGSHRLAEDRLSGALEMILTTPTTLREVLKGQWMAIRHIHLFSYVLILLIYLVLCVVALDGFGNRDGWVVALFFVVVSLGDFVVVGYVAMWKGMRVTVPRNAPGAALFRVLLVPWLVWLGLLPLIHQIDAARIFFDYAAPYSFLVTGLIVWGLSSGFALWSARRRLARIRF